MRNHRKDNHLILTLNLTTCNKLTLSHSIVNLLVHSFLPLTNHLRTFMLLQNDIKLLQQFITQMRDSITEIVIALVDSYQEMIVLS